MRLLARGDEGCAVSPDVFKQLERKGLVYSAGTYAPTKWGVEGPSLTVALVEPGRMALVRNLLGEAE